MSRTQLHNCPVDSFSLEETVDHILKRLREKGAPMQHCVVNTYKFLLMERDPFLQSIVKNCSIINADGQSVVWALKLLGRPIKERVTGIDLMDALIRRACQERLSVYFFGAKPLVVEKVVTTYRAQCPTLEIAGYTHGYYRREGDEEIVLQSIRQAKPDLLFVALDSPRKEYWLHKHLPQLNVRFAMGVGGSFDVMAGLVSRAPRWMQKNGLEWLWRMKQEPRRMFLRYLKSHSLFLWIVFRESLNRRRTVFTPDVHA
jgi:N-acetylglucosaminyldiphosphoundecaprenol N-acetyl-beta-D-mannosaminyltransferase